MRRMPRAALSSGRARVPADETYGSMAERLLAEYFARQALGHGAAADVGRADHQDPWLAHSHSIVPGGFDVMSSTTRLIPGTSLMTRLLIVSSTSYGMRAQSAVIASSLVTARRTIG